MPKAEAVLVCDEKGRDLIIGTRVDGGFFLVGSHCAPLEIKEQSAKKIMKFIQSREKDSR